MAVPGSSPAQVWISAYFIASSHVLAHWMSGAPEKNLAAHLKDP